MVRTGQTLRTVSFRSSIHPDLPVEVIERRDLFARMTPSHLERPQRPTFDALLLMRSDEVSHSVDFAEIPGRRGRLVLVRAGQAQTWDTRSAGDATLVLGEASSLSPRPWFPGDPAHCDLDEQEFATTCALIDLLRYQQARFAGGEPSIRLMVALFDALRALFDRAVDEQSTASPPAAYLAFRAAVEQEFTRFHDVEHYARRIGYSARTVARLCQHVAGQSPKRIIADRLVLEAKRLLTQTEMSIAEVSSALGFSEPTNFTKFFVLRASTTPGEYRRRHRSWPRTP